MSLYEPGDRRIISGMRPSADLIFYIDIRSFIQDGHPVYQSTNEVVLTPDGIPDDYWIVVRRKAGAWPVWQPHIGAFRPTERWPHQVSPTGRPGVFAPRERITLGNVNAVWNGKMADVIQVKGDTYKVTVVVEAGRL